MSVSVQNYITGETAVELAASIEAAIRESRLGPGEPLPTVRAIAAARVLSPATVSAAFRRLRERGLIVTRGRRGTVVSARPALPARRAAPLPEGVVDLADGNPDPRLLPPLRRALAGIDTGHHLYGQAICDPELLRTAARQFAADEIPADHLTVVSGALDGLERVLAIHLRPGDRVAVEDPCFSSVLDLLQAAALVPVPVAIDDSGPRPESLERVLAGGIEALIVTPRAQNPSGACLDPARVRALRRVLRAHPDLLVLEDDHAGAVAGAPACTLCDARRSRWAVVRSVSKSLGPDLRLALMTGDATTIGRVEGRTLIGMRWVSHLLQRLVVALASQPDMTRRLERAANGYRARRDALLRSLADHRIEAQGRTGLNVWIPVPEESVVVSRLLGAGWAVTAGERFRIESPPAIRVCVASLAPVQARAFAADLAAILAPGRRTHSV